MKAAATYKTSCCKVTALRRGGKLQRKLIQLSIFYTKMMEDSPSVQDDGSL